MNAFCRKVIGFILLFFGATTDSFCQLDLRSYEAGFSAGTFIYQGDLTPARMGSYRTPGVNVNLFVNRILNPSFTLRTSLAFGKIKGNDARYPNPAWRQQRNFNFSSSVFELSELLIWNIGSTDWKFSPYLIGGAGLSFLNIKRDWNRFNAEYFSNEDVAARLAIDVAHELPRTIIVIPVGAGVECSLTNRLSLIGETTYRFINTDYLDGFSQAANASSKDRYLSHTIGLIYKFGKRSNLGCPANIQ